MVLSKSACSVKGAAHTAGAAQRGNMRVLLKVPKAKKPPLEAQPCHKDSLQLVVLLHFAHTHTRTSSWRGPKQLGHSVSSG